MSTTRREFLKLSAAAAATLTMPFRYPQHVPDGAPVGELSGAAIQGYLLGAAYYPEWWKENRWEEDFRKMNALSFNAVRMGEFAWSHFEPTPGEFNFAWMDQAIELAAKYDVQVILCTPTAALPPWLVSKHPEVLTGNKDGRYDPGGVRKGYNTNNHNVLAADKRIVSAMARHFVTADSWFSGKENMNFIKTQLKHEFVMAVKTNRVAALSKAGRQAGRWVAIKTLACQDHPLRVWLRGVEFPVLLFKQVFKNEDGSEGIRYLVASDLTLQAAELVGIYHKRWKTEEYINRSSIAAD